MLPYMDVNPNGEGSPNKGKSPIKEGNNDR